MMIVSKGREGGREGMKEGRNEGITVKQKVHDL